MDNSAKIAELNDQLRKGEYKGNHRIVITSGARDLAENSGDGPLGVLALWSLVQNFDKFSKGNNPHGERDFGAFEAWGEKLYWKIDYYDANLEYGSEDPSDPKQTTRVLTIMLASEY